MRVRWSERAAPANDYPAFRAYLELVFMYAGTRSLARDLERVPSPRQIEPGDLFVAVPGTRADGRAELSAFIVGARMPGFRVAARTELIRRQLERFLDFDGPRAAVMRDNAEWLRPLGAIELLRDVGKHFPMGYMLAKESVKTRVHGEGMSYTEFSYMLLQAFDFVQLAKLHGCRLQVGGSDQYGNIVKNDSKADKLDDQMPNWPAGNDATHAARNTRLGNRGISGFLEILLDHIQHQRCRSELRANGNRAQRVR